MSLRGSLFWFTIGFVSFARSVSSFIL